MPYYDRKSNNKYIRYSNHLDFDMLVGWSCAVVCSKMYLSNNYVDINKFALIKLLQYYIKYGIQYMLTTYLGRNVTAHWWIAGEDQPQVCHMNLPHLSKFNLGNVKH